MAIRELELELRESGAGIKARLHYANKVRNLGRLV